MSDRNQTMIKLNLRQAEQLKPFKSKKDLHSIGNSLSMAIREISKVFNKSMSLSTPNKQILEVINTYNLLRNILKECMTGCKINYESYLLFKDNQIKCNHVLYTQDNRKKYGCTIPKKVTELGNFCFSNCEMLRTIETLTLNDNYCFGCDASTTLTLIVLPFTIKKLGSKCFYNCSNLKFVQLPDSLEEIGEQCFRYCSEIETIKLPPLVKTLSKGCFSQCSKLIKIDLPPALTTLGLFCFYQCTSLPSIFLPPSLKIMCDYCLGYCHSLKEIHVTNETKEIEYLKYFRNRLVVDLSE
ncbi:hypothetical protein QTN25_008328 [Entamoeba marina]